MHLRHRRRLGGRNRADEARPRLSFEGLLPGQHLEQHAAEREEVGARVRFEPFDLLRSHVLERAENGALRGDARRRRRRHRAGAGDRRRVRFREAEVEQLRARLRQHHVAGLQIAMDDASAMRRVERRRHLNRDRQGLSGRQRALRQSVPQRFSVEQFHDEERGAVVLADVVKRTDVRVGQLGDRACFAVESLAKLRIGGERVGQDFDRDRPVEPRIPRFEHLAHAARAERSEDLVRAEAGTGASGMERRSS